MRPRIDYRSASKAAFTDFINRYPATGISRQQYTKVITTFNAALVDHILETGQRIRLPFGLGELSIARYRPRKLKTFTGKQHRKVTILNLPIDWHKTRQTGKLVYHLNAHTDGYRFRWKWFGKKALFESAHCFSFRPNRTASRKLARYLKSDPKYAQIYREWDDK